LIEEATTMARYERRYPGTRWSILYGAYDGVEAFALRELQRAAQRYFPYVIETRQAQQPDAATGEHLLLIGSVANNARIRELVESGRVPAPAQPQGYTLTCLDSPWAERCKVVAIAGADPAGVLYGVEHFNAHILAARVMPDNPIQLRSAFDAMPPFSISEAPAIANRGIWTWGYVIYDYRRFVDHMARLRLNMLTLWNDCPPVNCREVIDYAHSRGVQVILGFHWGWGVGLDLADAQQRRAVRDEVVRNYLDNYRGLGVDGIYFQSTTEHSTTDMGGRSTAALACEFVNETARALYAEQPDLYIQFGLHATSIRDHYADLAPLDPRVVIVWEDAGVIPYAYDPQPKDTVVGWDRPWNEVNSTAGTLAYSQALATFRDRDDKQSEFAMVAKGWSTLRWGEEFEHHGPFILGEREAAFIRWRLAECQPRWDRVDTLWLQHYPHAVSFYRGILDCAPARMTVTGLIEDGLFELAAPISVALFAETLWNPRRDEAVILQRAMSPYYKQAADG
jgi:hypothetical protein